MDIILTGFLCIASTCLGLYWGIMVGELIAKIKVTRRK